MVAPPTTGAVGTLAPAPTKLPEDATLVATDRAGTAAKPICRASVGTATVGTSALSVEDGLVIGAGAEITDAGMLPSGAAAACAAAEALEEAASFVRGAMAELPTSPSRTSCGGLLTEARLERRREGLASEPSSSGSSGACGG